MFTCQWAIDWDGNADLENLPVRCYQQSNEGATVIRETPLSAFLQDSLLLDELKLDAQCVSIRLPVTAGSPPWPEKSWVGLATSPVRLLLAMDTEAVSNHLARLDALGIDCRVTGRLDPKNPWHDVALTTVDADTLKTLSTWCLSINPSDPSPALNSSTHVRLVAGQCKRWPGLWLALLSTSILAFVANDWAGSALTAHHQSLKSQVGRMQQQWAQALAPNPPSTTHWAKLKRTLTDLDQSAQQNPEQLIQALWWQWSSDGAHQVAALLTPPRAAQSEGPGSTQTSMNWPAQCSIKNKRWLVCAEAKEETRPADIDSTGIDQGVQHANQP